MANGRISQTVRETLRTAATAPGKAHVSQVVRETLRSYKSTPQHARTSQIVKETLRTSAQNNGVLRISQNVKETIHSKTGFDGRIRVSQNVKETLRSILQIGKPGPATTANRTIRYAGTINVPVTKAPYLLPNGFTDFAGNGSLYAQFVTAGVTLFSSGAVGNFKAYQFTPTALYETQNNSVPTAGGSCQPIIINDTFCVQPGFVKQQFVTAPAIMGVNQTVKPALHFVRNQYLFWQSGWDWGYPPCNPTLPDYTGSFSTYCELDSRLPIGYPNTPKFTHACYYLATPPGYSYSVLCCASIDPQLLTWSFRVFADVGPGIPFNAAGLGPVLPDAQAPQRNGACDYEPGVYCFNNWLFWGKTAFNPNQIFDRNFNTLYSVAFDNPTIDAYFQAGGDTVLKPGYNYWQMQLRGLPQTGMGASTYLILDKQMKNYWILNIQLVGKNDISLQSTNLDFFIDVNGIMYIGNPSTSALSINYGLNIPFPIPVDAVPSWDMPCWNPCYPRLPGL